MNPDNQDCILDLKALSGRSCLSVRTLQDYTQHDHPHMLPHFKLKGKKLVSWLEYKTWLEQYRVTSDFNEKVNDIVIELRKQGLRQQKPK